MATVVLPSKGTLDSKRREASVETSTGVSLAVVSLGEISSDSKRWAGLTKVDELLGASSLQKIQILPKMKIHINVKNLVALILHGILQKFRLIIFCLRKSRLRKSQLCLNVL